MAGYFIILRGKLFTVGDRISMGGVRGDVTDVAFFQTTIMEMGHSIVGFQHANGLECDTQTITDTCWSSYSGSKIDCTVDNDPQFGTCEYANPWDAMGSDYPGRNYNPPRPNGDAGFGALELITAGWLGTSGFHIYKSVPFNASGQFTISNVEAQSPNGRAHTPGIVSRATSA